jgi:signal transduction histidine kinase
VVPENIPDSFIRELDRRNIFLIVKELLNNIYKHSGATEVKLAFQIEENKTLKISIADNGKGMTAGPANPNGRGLKNTRIRIAQLDGSITVTRDEGVSVTLLIPLK